MAENWFLKIDGIEGHSLDKVHKGEIDVESWSWGVVNGRFEITFTGQNADGTPGSPVSAGFDVKLNKKL